MKNQKKPSQTRLILEELEARQLFSGGLEGLIVHDSQPAVVTYMDIDPSNTKLTQDEVAVSVVEQQSHEIVFIDTGVENHQTLVDDILNNSDNNRNIEVVILNNDRNGIDQISETLHEKHDLDAIHIISHGDDGRVQLGSTTLDSQSLSENNLAIALWANSFDEAGDILIYGCNLAQTEIGENLIKNLSELTLTDVAASDNLTGYGGDWILEYQSGSLETEIALSAELQNSFAQSLAVNNLSSGIELNTDEGNDALLIANDGGAIIGGLSHITVEISFSVDQVASTPLISYAADAQNDLLFLLVGDGTAFLGLNLDSSSLSGINYNTLMDGVLHHLALSWDNNNGDWQVYVDGVLTDNGTGLATGETIAGAPGTGELIFGQEQDTIGGGFTTDQVFKGTYYDVRIWDQIRSEPEISMNSQQKLDINNLPSNLVANWQMDGFNGSNEVVDIVSGNNLSIDHATGLGFIASTPIEDLHISESVTDGTSVGYVIPTDPVIDQALSNFTFSLIDNAGGRFAIDNNTGEITVANASLLDYEASTSHNITVEVTDWLSNTYSEVMSITVNNFLDINLTLPGAQSVDEDQVLTFSSANSNAVSIFVGSSNSIQVTLSANDGVLTLSQTTGLTFIEGSDSSGSFVINGTEANINGALEGMTFTPNANFNGNVSLNMTASLDAGLAGYYTFEGGNANDQSAGTPQNGTFNGDATTLIDGTRGEVLSLDGVGDSVTINSSSFGQPTALTLSGWANFTSDGGRSDFIGMDGVGVYFDHAANGVTGYIQTGAASWVYLTTPITVSDAGWHHIAYSYDDAANTNSLYIDGTLVATATINDSIYWNGVATTFIGQHISNTDWDLNGLIDDVRVYTRALSTGEIASLANESNSASDTITISVVPVNDAGIFGGNTSATTNEDTATAGSITFSDAVDGFTVANFTINSAATNGSAVINAAGDWTYTPSANYNGVDSFTVEVTDNEGHVETQVISITVTAVNDAAIIAGTDIGSVQEDVSVVTGNISTSGTLTITDVDSGESSFQAGTIIGSYGSLVMQTNGNWIYTADNTQAAIQQLDLGESITDTLTVSAFDGTTHNIVITLNGSDDAAVISGTITGSVTEDGALTSSGLLTITDTDISDPSNFADVPTTASDNGYGTFVMTGNSWTYTLSNSHPSVQALDVGETLTDTFTFTAPDGVTQQVTVTINGAEDTPVFNSTAVTAATEDSAYSYSITTSDVDIENVTITAPTLPTWLTFIDNGDGTASLTGTPTNAEVGDHSVVLNVSDGSLSSNQSFTISVANTNDPAVIAGTDTGSVQEDVSVVTGNINTSGTLTISDVDIGESSFQAGTIIGSYGSLVMQTNGNWIYTADNTQAAIQQLDLGESITDTLTVSAFDGTAHNIVITLNGSDDAAVISGTTTGSVTEDGTLTSSGLLTITDTDISDPTNFADVPTTASDNGYGTFEMTGNSWTFTLNNSHAAVQALDVGETLTDTFTFTAPDGVTQQVTVTINGAEDTPLFDSTAVTAATEDSSYSYSISTSDLDVENVTITAPTLPAWLTLTDNGDGTATLSGTPTNAEVGDHNVVLNVSDGSLNSNQNFTITVANTNDAAIISGTDTGSVQEDVAVTTNNISISAALTITDVDNGESSFQAGTVNGIYGDLSIDTAGNWSYSADNTQVAIQQLDLGESITDTLMVSAFDGTTHNVIITIHGSDDTAVVGGTTTGTVTEDGTLTSSGLLTITDTDTSDPTDFADVLATASDNGYGTFEMTGNSWTFTLNNSHAAVQALDVGETLTDTFSFTAPDGVTQQVTVTINGAEDTPLFDSTAVTAATEDSSYSYSITTSDVDIENVTITAPTLPTWLNFADNGDGTASLTGTPSNAEVGDHSVVLNVSDGSLSSNQSFTITVTNTNDAPISSPVILNVINEDSGPRIISQAELLSNASDLDAADVLTATGLTVSNGTGILTDNGDGSWTYLASSNDDSGATFTYNITDGIESIANTATLDILPVNDVPTANPESYSINEDTSLANINVLSNDTDSDGDLLTIVNASSQNANVTINQDGTLNYLPNADYYGSDAINYTITDGKGGSATGTVSVMVNPVVDTISDHVSTSQGFTLNIDTLQNDSFNAGASIIEVSTASNGTVSLVQDGTITYIPDEDFFGADQFEYKVIDVHGNIETGTVYVNVAKKVTVSIPEFTPPDIANPDDTDIVEIGPPQTETETETETDSQNIEQPVTTEQAEQVSEILSNIKSTIDLSSNDFVDLPVKESRNYYPVIKDQKLVDVINAQALQDQLSNQFNLDMFNDEEAELYTQEDHMLWKQIDEMHKTMEDDLSQDQHGKVEVQIALGSTAGLTVGFISWVLRGGTLLASLLSTVPLLNRFDPLPIIKSLNKKQKARKENKDENNKNDSNVDKLFSRKSVHEE